MSRTSRESIAAVTTSLLAALLMGGAVAPVAAASGSGGAAPSGGPAGSLTHQYPLGTQPLSSTTGAAPTTHATPTTRPAPTTHAAPTVSATTTHAKPTTAPLGRLHSRNGSPTPALIVLIAIAVVLLAAVGWFIARARSRRARPPGAPRPRRDVPRRMLRLLNPVFRYDYPRDAWVLRGVGERHGPVLRRRPATEPEKPPLATRRQRNEPS